MNKKKRYQPHFNFINNMKILNRPLIIGTIYGVSPLLIGTGLLYSVSSFVTSTTLFPSSWDSIILDKNTAQIYENGRLAVALFIFGLLFSYRGITSMIPLLNSQEEMIIKKNIINKIIEEKKEKRRNERENLLEDTLKKKQIFFRDKFKTNLKEKITLEKYPLISPNYVRKRKQKNFLFTVFLVAVFSNIILQLKNFHFFNNNLNWFLFFFIILEQLIETILCRFLLKELLLVAPILVSLEYTQQLLIPSKNFDTFLNTSALRLFLVGLVRITVDPFFHYIKLAKYRLISFLKQKAEYNEKYEKILSYFKNSKINKTRAVFFTERPYKKTKVSSEFVIKFLLYISTKACVNVIRIFISFLPFFFPSKNEKPMTSLEFSQTLLPQFILCIAHNLIDFLIVYLMERLHNYNIYEYLRFANFKYRKRKTDWLLKSINLDVSLKIKFRTIDFLGFSAQYYYTVILMGGGITLLVWSIHICYNEEYNPFKDPASILFIPMFWIYFNILRMFGVLFDNLFQVWKKQKVVVNNKFSSSLVVENYLKDHIDVHSREFIINDFIKKKKDFLIENLPRIIKREDFFKNDGFLLELYNSLSNSIKEEQINKLKLEIVTKNIHKNRNLPIEDFIEKIKNTKKQQLGNLTTILYYWFFLSKDLIYFKKLVINSKDKFLNYYCEKCRAVERLFVIEIKSFQEIFKEYRIFLMGKINNNDEWIAFYEKKQNFITLCHNCKKIFKIKNFKKNNKKKFIKKPDYDLKVFRNQKIFKEITKEDVKPTTLKFLNLWCMSAKSNILHKKTKNIHQKKIMKINSILEGMEFS